MNLKLNKRSLLKIWEQVPPDYYFKGVKTNFFQWIWHDHKFNSFKRLVKDRSNVGNILDVGCADGTLTNKIAQTFPKSKVVGIDVYSKALNLARKKYPRIKFIKANAHKLPFQKNAFDLIVCFETIEHVVDPIKVLKEIRRVLRPSGQAIVVMDSGSLLFRLIWWVWEHTKGKVWAGAHLHPFTHQELGETIEKAGFKVLKKNFSHLGMEVIFVLKK